MNRMIRRNFVRLSAAFGLGVASRPSRAFTSANEEVRIGLIGCGGRGGEHLSVFSKLDGIKIAGLCDPDEKRLHDAKMRFPDAKAWADIGELVVDKNIDAVVIASCNHWHCLASIWAMQAGKDVYVEKPLSHSQWEGRQTVAAAFKYKRICQVGMQQRSDPMQIEIKKFLHEDKALGDVKSVRVNRYGVRQSIGKRTEPLSIDPSINMDLWLGPAQEKPILRDKLQYDWHWDWNTGCGEMGNWGIHVLDDVRNNVFLDKVRFPSRVFSGGGRVAWNDAGETPNVQFVYFQAGAIPVVIGLSNLPATPTSNKSPERPGPSSGYIVYCEGGRLEGQRGSAAAFDSNGDLIKKFSGNSGNGLHQQNFIDAVRTQDPLLLNANVKIGHESTGWCNLANIAFRAGVDFDSRMEGKIESSNWLTLMDEMREHLKSHSISFEDPEMKFGPILDFDPTTESFVGDLASLGDIFLKRQYRPGYAVPQMLELSRKTMQTRGPIKVE